MACFTRRGFADFRTWDLARTHRLCGNRTCVLSKDGKLLRQVLLKSAGIDQNRSDTSVINTVVQKLGSFVFYGDKYFFNGVAFQPS